jgi:invasion protein IalB
MTPQRLDFGLTVPAQPAGPGRSTEQDEVDNCCRAAVCDASNRDGCHRRRRVAVAGMAAAMLVALAPAPQAATPAGSGQSGPGQKYQSDEWITECEPAGGGADCSITAPFWDQQGNNKGSFALVVMLQSSDVAIVGQPFPVRAQLRVDKNPAIECIETRYCVFPGDRGRALIRQLKAGSLILVDIFTGTAGFHFSLTAKGYQAGLAKIGAWGYRFPQN